MPEGTGSAASTDATSGSGATPDKGAAGKSTGAAATADTGGDGGSPDLGDAGQQAIEREREAAREAKRLLKETQAELKQLREKDLPEAERTAGELAELRATNDRLTSEIQRYATREAVFATASRLGFADPTDAFRLVDVELDDDGKPKGVEAALNKLLQDKPYLKAGQARAATGGSADAGNAGLPTGADDMNANIRRLAGKAPSPS
jgi:hypothetical protein